MEDIKDLIRIVIEFTKRNIPLIDIKAQERNGNKELNLFLGLKDGLYETDMDASKGIYGTEDVDFKFRMLKSRLNRKLLNHLFFIDFNSSKLPRSASFQQECRDSLYYARCLLMVGEEKLGTKMLYKTIDLAKENEYTDIIISCLKELRNVYASQYRPKLFQNIKQQLEEYYELSAREEDAYSVYYETKLMLNTTINNRKKSLKPVEEALRNLEAKCLSTDSYNVYGKYIKLRIWHHGLTGDYKRLLEFLDRLEDEFRKGIINNNRFNIYILKTARIHALLQLRKFEKGMSVVESYLSEMDEDHMYWLVLMEYNYLLSMQSKQFAEGSHIMNTVLNHKNYDSMDEQVRSRWDIYRAYSYFLTKDKRLIKKFDVDAYLSKTPEYKKENAGLNVALIIIQIMNSINDDLKTLHGRLDALDDYVSKYLNNSFSKRTKLFAKLLHKLAIHNRDYETILVKSKYLEEKLHSTKMIPEVYSDIEVVPFEYLWEIVVSELKEINAPTP